MENPFIKKRVVDEDLGERVKKELEIQKEMSPDQLEAEQRAKLEESNLKIRKFSLTPKEIEAHEEREKRAKVLKKAGEKKAA